MGVPNRETKSKAYSRRRKRIKEINKLMAKGKIPSQWLLPARNPKLPGFKPVGGGLPSLGKNAK